VKAYVDSTGKRTVEDIFQPHQLACKNKPDVPEWLQRSTHYI